jgi:ribosome recycling factor
MTLKETLSSCHARMDKSTGYLEQELRGIRTGRASTALLEYIKVDYYGSSTDLREMAVISVPEPTQLLVKPFDPTSKGEIVKAIETADLGLNPQTEENAIRINVPAPSTERRKQLSAQVRKMAEEAKVAVRNERRDANKQIDTLVKDKTNNVSEDQGRDAKSQVDDETKKHIDRIDAICAKKTKEVEEL